MPHSRDTAHDLRNLLTVIVGYCELPSPNLSAIKSAAERSLQLVQALFPTATLARSSTRFDLNEIVIEVYDAAQSAVDPHCIEILLEINHERFFSVEGDGLQIHRALLNLALNAIAAVKKRPPDQQIGKVKIETRVEANSAMVSISDNGIGMSSDQLKLLVVHQASIDAQHGRGFGIVTSTIARLGGKMTAKSELGVGSEFVISLPLADEENTGPSSQPMVTG